MNDPGASEEVPVFEESLAAIVLAAKEALIAPMRPKLNDFDITEPQWRVIRLINERGSMDIGGLAETTLLHGSSVTRILKQLETRSLIVRKLDAKDRRRTTVTLSPGGHGVVKILLRDVRYYADEFSKAFGADRIARLAQELKELTTALKSIK